MKRTPMRLFGSDGTGNGWGRVLVLILAFGLFVGAGNASAQRAVVAPQDAAARVDDNSPQPTSGASPRLEGPHVVILRPINVRAGPSTRFPVIAVARPGPQYAVTGRNAAGTWWRIDYLGRAGWLYAPLVRAVDTDAVPVIAGEPTSTPTTATTAGRDGASVRVLIYINVRAGPGTRFPVIAVARPGQMYPITGVDRTKTWWQIDFDGRPAWLYAPLVRALGADDVPVVADEAAPLRPTPTPVPAENLAPAPAPVGTVVVYESSVTLPTYPYERYQSDARNATFNWPYKRFDRERFLVEHPTPEDRSYKLLVLENAYLVITVLPELGGRIWQVIHKPTGANMFYQNPVVKPSPWGPPEQLGWLGVGGMEWSLPVVEHGYDWGVPWGYLPLQHSPNLASVTVFTPRDGRYLNASITVSLRAGAASFEVEPTITNLSERTLDFAYWSTAMLAPGRGNRPSRATHFLVSGSQMTVHSTGDPRLPAPGEAFSWPVYGGVDYSWLGNWNRWLGFFERPAAHGPFAAVYDYTADAGAVRVYPARVARGSKVFGLGWQSAIGSDNFTDDSSAYVELHGGLAPTFEDTYRLPAGGSVKWREIWYPVNGIGGLTYADEVAAVHVRPGDGGLAIGFYPTRPLDGSLVVTATGREIGHSAVQSRPEHPFDAVVVRDEALPDRGPLSLRFVDAAGRTLFDYTYRGRLR